MGGYMLGERTGDDGACNRARGTSRGDESKGTLGLVGIEQVSQHAPEYACHV